MARVRVTLTNKQEREHWYARSTATVRARLGWHEGSSREGNTTDVHNTQPKRRFCLKAGVGWLLCMLLLLLGYGTSTHLA